MRSAGLSAVHYRRFGLGSVALHVGTVATGVRPEATGDGVEDAKVSAGARSRTRA